MERETAYRINATLPADADAPHAARNALADIRPYVTPDVMFRLRLLVTEAISERVLERALHGGGGAVRFEFSERAGVLRGRVSDVGPTSSGVSFHPLQAGMLEAMADDWGTGPGPAGGAEIWFELARAGERSPAEYSARFSRGSARVTAA